MDASKKLFWKADNDSQLAYLGFTQVRAVVPGAALGAYQALASFGVQFTLIYPTSP